MSEYLSIKSITNPKVEIKQAEMIGDYSLNANRKFCPNGKENLKFLKNYNWNSISNIVNFDLNEDIGGRITKTSLNTEKITHILQWICLNKEKLYVETDDIKRIFPHFVCFRGRISQILNTPYSTDEPWIFDVVKYRGTIYLSEVETEKKLLEREKETAHQIQCSAWGFKFEQCILGEDGPVNENLEYACVFKTMMGPHSLLSVAEVDAADFEMHNNSKKDDIRSFLEFKTNKLFSYPNAENIFCRYKPRKWWAQSAIIGIPEIICGFRTNEGIVTETRPFNVTQLPFYNEQKLFDTNVMLNFTLRFLEWLKKIILQDHPTVYRIERTEGNNPVTCNISMNDSFISQEYLNEMFPS